jgi:hypothetical protein
MKKGEKAKKARERKDVPGAVDTTLGTKRPFNTR